MTVSGEAGALLRLSADTNFLPTSLTGDTPSPREVMKVNSDLTMKKAVAEWWAGEQGTGTQMWDP